MVCLETSFLVDLLGGHEPARDTMDSIDSDGVRPTLAPVAAAEVWVGAGLGSNAAREATAALFESLTWLPFTREAARRSGEIRAALTRAGAAIGIIDATIVGIAIEHDETLVTCDACFERVPELRTRTY